MVTRGSDALSRGFKELGMGSTSEAPTLWSGTQWPACLEDRSMTAAQGSPFPSHPQVCLLNAAPPGSAPSLSPDRTPVSASAPPLAPLSTPASPAVSCVCLCVGTSPISLLWESLGRAGGEVRSRSHLVSLLNSFLPRTSCPRQLPFLLGLGLLPADSLLPAPPTSTHSLPALC